MILGNLDNLCFLRLRGERGIFIVHYCFKKLNQAYSWVKVGIFEIVYLNGFLQDLGSDIVEYREIIFHHIPKFGRKTI